MMLALLALLAFAAVARGGYPGSVESRLQQLEQEVVRLREENRQQQLELESQALRGSVFLPDRAPSNAAVAIPTAYDELSPIEVTPPPPPPPPPPRNRGDSLQQLASDVEETRLTLQRLETKVDQLGDNMTVSLLDKQWSATITGAMIGEMICSEQRPIIPSAIVLLSPDCGNNTPTLDVHGKSSKIAVLFRGPDYKGFQTGGGMLAYFFGENFLADIAGINLIGGYVELKNDRWRFLFGRAGDLINPRRPDTIDFNSGRNAGNVGFTRGQFRAERYIPLSCNSQITAQFALCNPIATAYNGNLSDLVEDNGWPLLEGRTVLGIGPVTKKFGVERRRYEIGGSGVLGQLRHATVGDSGLIDVWLLGLDGKADLTDRCGVKGEFFCGQAVGNLNGGIMRSASGLIMAPMIRPARRSRRPVTR